MRFLIVGLLAIISGNVNGQSNDSLKKKFFDLQDKMDKINESYDSKFKDLGDFKISEAMEARYEKDLLENMSKKEIEALEKEMEKTAHSRETESSMDDTNLSKEDIAEFEKELATIKDEQLRQTEKVSENATPVHAENEDIKEFLDFFNDTYEGESLENTLARLSKEQALDIKSSKSKNEKKYVVLSYQLEQELVKTEYEMYAVAQQIMKM